MDLLTVNSKGNQILVNEFFGQFNEFSENVDLLKQTSRILKTMLRHPEREDIMYLPTTSKHGDYFCVNGRERVYNIYFEIRDGVLVLTAIN